MKRISKYLYLFSSIGIIGMITSLQANQSEQTNPQYQSTYNLLFVGNSLTYTNNLPSLVKQKAAEKGIRVTTKTLANPNYAIVDHWADGDVQNLIKSQLYDFVIIQQGPSSQQDGYNMLINGGRDYSDLTQANGAKLAYFMVWPDRRFYYTFSGVIDNYTSAAAYNNAILLPVGKVWKEYFDQTNDFSYYGPDNFHPSLKGSLVAAEIIVDSLFAESVEVDNSQQAWLIGLGQIENNQINIPEVYITDKGAFGQDFEPDEIENTLWGSMHIEFNSCHDADMSYTSTALYNGTAFGSGHYPIQRVAMNQASQNCEQHGFIDNLDKSFFSGSFYGGQERSGEGFNLDYLNENQVIVTWYTYLPKSQ